MEMYKPDTVLTPDAGSAYQVKYKELKLISSSRREDVTYWWCLMTEKSGLTYFETFPQSSIAASWSERPSFFRGGKKYRYKGQAFQVYQVVDIFTNDDPMQPMFELQALARVKDNLMGGTRMTLLDSSHFGSMEEIR